MTRSLAVLWMVAVFLVATSASAQETAASFEALAGRLQVGQRIWVTDATGREVGGRLERISADGLVLEANGSVKFAAPDVRRVRARDRDSLKNGTLIGLVIGAGMGTAWCLGAIADDSGDIDAGVECAEGFTVFPGLGALIGLAVDAVIPGRARVVYEASAASRRTGLALSFAF